MIHEFKKGDIVIAKIECECGRLGCSGDTQDKGELVKKSSDGTWLLVFEDDSNGWFTEDHLTPITSFGKDATPSAEATREMEILSKIAILTERVTTLDSRLSTIEARAEHEDKKPERRIEDLEDSFGRHVAWSSGLYKGINDRVVDSQKRIEDSEKNLKHVIDALKRDFSNLESSLQDLKKKNVSLSTLHAKFDDHAWQLDILRRYIK